ncbi:MAG: MFS transporter [Tagaea sp.]|nr:MFS transporter [Tagaea sp.]
MNALVVPLAVTLSIQIAISGAGLAGAVLAPIANDDLGLAAAFVGIYVAYMYAAAAIATATSGAWLQRFGPIGTSQICLGFSGMSLLAISTGTLWGFALAGLLAGLGYGPTTPASSAILARVGRPDQRNLIFSIKQTGVPGGNMLAAAAMPSLALAFGWQGAAAIGGIVVLLLAVALAPLRKGMDAAAPVARAPSLRAALVEPMRAIWARADLRRLALVSIAYSGLQGALSAFLIVFLVEDAALGIVGAGFVLAVAQAAGVGGRVLWGVVADRLGTPALVLGLLGVAMGAFGIAMAATAPLLPIPALVALAACFGGTAVAWNGVYLAEVARLAGPAQAGEMIGASGFFTFGGVALLPFAFTMIVLAAGSYALAYGLISAPAILCGIWLLRGRAEASKPLS